MENAFLTSQQSTVALAFMETSVLPFDNPHRFCGVLQIQSYNERK